MADRTLFIDRLRDGLGQLLAETPRAILLGEDLADPYGGAFKATRGLSTRFPDRVRNTPICEAGIVGTSIGLSLAGWFPVAEIMFGDFVTLCADQLINHAAKLPAMYGHRFRLPLLVRTPTGAGRGYGPTHSQSLEKCFLGVPGLQVVALSSYHDPALIPAACLATGRPTLCLEPKLSYAQPLGSETLNLHALSADPLAPVLVTNFAGDPATADLLVVGYGSLPRLLEAVLPDLAREEINVTAVVHARLSPWESAPLLGLARTVRRVLLVEEANVDFGWTAELAATLAEHSTGTTLRRLGARNRVLPAATDAEQETIVTPDSLRTAILALLRQ